jgi:hypothetical protein
MDFSMFADSDYEALELIVKLEQAKRMMEMVTCAADRQEGENEGEGGEGEGVVLGDWFQASVAFKPSAVSAVEYPKW